MARKGIYPNLDYPSGPAYNLIGFDTLTFTPLFVAARITGWTAHIMEQLAVERPHPPALGVQRPRRAHIEGYCSGYRRDPRRRRAAEEAEG